MYGLYSQHWGGWPSLALLVLRLVVGTKFILHGWPKIQNPMHWMGDATPILQLAAALAEFGGGIALILGFLTPIASAALAINMFTFAQDQPFVRGSPGGSFEIPFVYFAIMVAFLWTGPGAYSLDAMVFGRSGAAAERRQR